MRHLLFSFLCLLQYAIVSGQTSLELIDLPHGDYAVGFRHTTLIDSTRTYQRLYDWSNEKTLRPIPVSIWEPADVKPEKQPLNILDYLQVFKEEEEWEHLPNKYLLDWFDHLPNTPENQKHLKELSKAYTDVPAAKGKFPVIIYAASYQASSIENFALCEFLASHGYIVIASPSRSADTRFLEGGTAKDLEAQARDIEFLIPQVLKMPHADYDNIATMGFSFGGISNVLAQMRNENIKAIVSLDGSVKYQYEKLKKSPFFNIDKVDVPFIHFSQKKIPKQVIIEDKLDSTLDGNFEFFDSLRYSDAYHFTFHDLTHSYFSTYGVLLTTRDSRQDKSDPEIMQSYKWMSLYTLHFLDAHLKNEPIALKFLTNPPEENGVSPGVISKESKKAQSQRMTLRHFNDLAAQQDYKDLEELYKMMLKKHPNLRLPEPVLNNLGLQFMFNPKTSKYAVKIFELAVFVYPQSSNLYDSLAEAYLTIGNEEKARINYQKSLELNPENTNAAEQLKRLK